MKNNRGFTVVELIITFALVMSLAVGLFAVTDNYRERQQKETVLKELNSYRNEILKIVQDDFLNRGIEDIEGIDATSCSGDFNQAVKIVYKDDPNDEVKFCVGDVGIKYGDILYPKPLGEFVSFTNDIIYTESKEYDVDIVRGSVIVPTKKKILSINVKMKHSEFDEVIELRVVGVNTTVIS